MNPHIIIGDRKFEGEPEHLATLFELACICARKRLPLALDKNTCILLTEHTRIEAHIPNHYTQDANHPRVLRELRKRGGA